MRICACCCVCMCSGLCLCVCFWAQDIWRARETVFIITLIDLCVCNESFIIVGFRRSCAFATSIQQRNMTDSWPRITIDLNGVGTKSLRPFTSRRVTLYQKCRSTGVRKNLTPLVRYFRLKSLTTGVGTLLTYSKNQARRMAHNAMVLKI